MNSWGNRNNFHRDLATGLLSANAKNADSPIYPQLPDTLAQWLGQLTLLYGVPIEYLVPDTRLLPMESIRFFYIDRNWLDRLVDGAMSVGVLSSKDNIFNQAFFQDIYQQVDVAQQNVRNSIRSVETVKASQAGGVMTGLLFRSQVVTAYPGVEIYAYDVKNNPLTMLRMDRLSDTLILCIFDDVPVQVDFIQPSEGLHFGIQREAGAQDFTVQVRGLGYPTDSPQPAGYPAGLQIQNPPNSGQYVSAPGSLVATSGPSEGVVNIKDLATSIASVMQNLTPPSLSGDLTPGGLAIQLVVGAGIQSYKLKEKDGNPPPACEVGN